MSVLDKQVFNTERTYMYVLRMYFIRLSGIIQYNTFQLAVLGIVVQGPFRVYRRQNGRGNKVSLFDDPVDNHSTRGQQHSRSSASLFLAPTATPCRPADRMAHSAVIMFLPSSLLERARTTCFERDANIPFNQGATEDRRIDTDMALTSDR